MERFGFIHDKLDVKVLILFILNRLENQVNLNTLAELTICDDGFSYFDFLECVGDLVSSGHVTEEEGFYTITEKGRRNGSITESTLPYSIKQKVEKLASALAVQQRRDAMIKTSHDERPSGEYTVHLSLSDGLGDILSISILAGSLSQAEALETGFSQRAEKLYSVLVNEIIRDV